VDTAARLEAAARHSGQPDALVQTYITGMRTLLARGGGGGADGVRPNSSGVIRPPSPPASEAVALKPDDSETDALSATLSALLAARCFAFRAAGLVCVRGMLLPGSYACWFQTNI